MLADLQRQFDELLGTFSMFLEDWLRRTRVTSTILGMSEDKALSKRVIEPVGMLDSR